MLSVAVVYSLDSSVPRNISTIRELFITVNDIENNVHALTPVFPKVPITTLSIRILTGFGFETTCVIQYKESVYVPDIKRTIDK